MELKHGIIYGLLALVVILTGSVPFSGQDVAKLHPVETILAEYAAGQVCLTADTGDCGVGQDWSRAMEDMEKASAGVIFQGTVSYILLDNDHLLPALLENHTLNPNTIVCLVEGDADPAEAGAYLNTHRPESSLRRIRAGEVEQLPRLICRDGRYDLETGKG